MQVFLSEFVRAPRDRQFAAWIAALTASLAALFIAEIMGQSPCILSARFSVPSCFRLPSSRASLASSTTSA